MHNDKNARAQLSSQRLRCGSVFDCWIFLSEIIAIANTHTAHTAHSMGVSELIRCLLLTSSPSDVTQSPSSVPSESNSKLFEFGRSECETIPRIHDLCQFAWLPKEFSRISSVRMAFARDSSIPMMVYDFDWKFSLGPFFDGSQHWAGSFEIVYAKRNGLT